MPASTDLKTTRRPVVVIGAGPAGASAAIAAAEHGLEVTLIDEQGQVGGQIYRQPPAAFKVNEQPPSSTETRALRLRRELERLSDKIEILTETRVWGVFEDQTLAVESPQGVEYLAAERLVLAPGAYEFVPPFPGWTLPGVWTPGGAQTMVKTMGVLPGRRALVVGTGPFLLVVANQLVKSGVEVLAVVDAVRRREVLTCFPGLVAHGGRMVWEGWQYLKQLRSAGVPLITGQVIVRADGDESVTSATIAPCDQQWRPDQNQVRSFSIDTLCVGYGFIPRTQLAQLAGCRLHYRDELGGWLPELDEYGKAVTTEAVWSAGDGAGVAGAAVAELEGTLAGLSVACHAGRIDELSLPDHTREVRTRLHRLRRFRAALDRLCRIRPGLTSLAEDETVVCRCEELTLEEIRSAVRQGDPSFRALKVATRLGMGPCQGRMCWPGVARCAAAWSSQGVEELGPVSARPPIFPLTMGKLADSS